MRKERKKRGKREQYGGKERKMHGEGQLGRRKRGQVG